MAVNAQPLGEAEERLAALWQQPLHGGETNNDAATALFSSPDKAAPRAAAYPCAAAYPRGGRARRPPARPRPARSRESRSHQRHRRSRPTNRSLAVGATVAATLVLLPVALSALTDRGRSAAISARPDAVRSLAAPPPDGQSHDQLERQLRRAAQARGQRQIERRQELDRATRERTRTTPSHARRVRARAHQRDDPAPRMAKPNAASAAAQPQRSPVPPVPAASPACEEFPPC